MLPAAGFVIRDDTNAHHHHHPVEQAQQEPTSPVSSMQRTVNIDHTYLDDEATVLGATIANIDVPPTFQPILNEFYNEIFRIKYKLNELRTIQRQFNHWIGDGVNVYQAIVDNSVALAATEPKNNAATVDLFSMHYETIVTELSSKLTHIVNTVISNLQSIHSERIHDRSYDVRDTIIDVIGDLGELAYQIEQHLMAYRDVYDSIRNTVQ